MIAFVKNTYHEIPMEQFLAEVNESQDWQELKYYKDLYWTNIDGLLDDAVRFGADRVIREIAPHILFDNEKRLTECLAQAPNEATRAALTESFIPRRDEDYAMYPFSMVRNLVLWKSREDCRVCKLVSFADGIQDKIWQGFLNRYAFGSELLFFEHVTSKYAVDREHTGIEWVPDRVMPLVHAMGYRLCSDGFEQMRIPAYWQKNYDDRRYTAIDKIWYSASALGLVLKKIGWEEKRDEIVNAFGVTGYTYLENVPEIEQRITDEDRILKLFHAAFNGKMPWSDIAPLISENCHYYSDGSGKDITGGGQIVAFLEDLNRRINTPELQCHAHYARLKKPECDPKLLEHKEGERVLALWQGEIGGVL